VLYPFRTINNGISGFYGGKPGELKAPEGVEAAFGCGV